MRAKNRKCPMCGQMFSSQGLAGHLRWVHQLDAMAVRDVLDGRAHPQPAPPQAPAPEPAKKQDGSGAGGFVAAILVAGLAIAAIIAAKQEEGRNRGYCARCKQGLDYTKARREGVATVQCPACGQLNFVPPANGSPNAPQAAAQQTGGVAGSPVGVVGGAAGSPSGVAGSPKG